MARNHCIQTLPDHITIVDWLRRAALMAAAVLGIMWGNSAWSQVQLNSRVVDTTGTLTAEQQGALHRKLAAFEAARGTQIVVVMVGSTQPEAIEQYANRMSNLWKIGRHDVGDGLVLFVAKDDRKLRIEVSRALEGAVPDLAAKRVIDQAITPKFKQGDFAGGIGVGVDRLIELIEAEGLPTPLHAETHFHWFAAGVVLFTLLLFWMGIRLDLKTDSYGDYSAVKHGVSTHSAGSGWSSSSGSSSGGGGFSSGGGGSFGGGGASGSW